LLCFCFSSSTQNTGTLFEGATSSFVYFTIVVLAVALGFVFVHRENRALWLLAALLMPLSLVTGGALAGWYYLPMTLLVSLWFLYTQGVFSRMPQFFRNVALVLSLAVLGYLFLIQFGIGADKTGKLQQLITSPEATIANLQVGMAKNQGGLTRFSVVQFAVDYLGSHNPIQWLIGFGPGSTNASDFLGTSGKLNSSFPTYRLDGNEVSVTILEFGVLGVLAEIWLMASLLRASLNHIRRCDDLFWRSVAVAFPSVLVVYGLAAVYSRTFMGGAQVVLLPLLLYCAPIFATTDPGNSGDQQ
jgi:hypothetical protein